MERMEKTQAKDNQGIKEVEEPIVIGEEEMEQLIEAANKKEQKQNKITQENEQKEINLKEDFSNDALYRDNGINEHEKELYYMEYQRKR